MVYIVGSDILLPFITTVINQFQSAASVLQPYARSAAIRIVLGIVGVVAGEYQSVRQLFQMNVNAGRSVAADTVLESVFY